MKFRLKTAHKTCGLITVSLVPNSLRFGQTHNRPSRLWSIEIPLK